jgi:carboxypeptidase Taq
MSDRSSAIARLNVLVGEVVDLRHAASLVGWDEWVSMPPGGVAVHGDMAAAIQRIAHEKFTSAGLGHALDGIPPART